MKYNRYPKRDAVKIIFLCRMKLTRTILLPLSTADLLRERKKTAVSEWIFPNIYRPEEAMHPEPAPRKIRKSGTGCLYQINDNLWEGSFFPRLPGGKRKKSNVCAETKEQCEIKLTEMIERVKNEIAEEKALRDKATDLTVNTY